MTCAVCGGIVRDANLCKACTRELERAIAELPADLRDLQLVATRQATGPLGLGDPNRQWDGPPEVGALGDEPWVFAPAAADQLWAAANTITTWIRHLCEARGVQSPTATRGTYETMTRLRVHRNRAHVETVRVFTPSPDQPMRPLVEWLLANLDAIRLDEAAAQIHDELTGLHAENERWILGRPGLDEYFGVCDAPDVRVEQAADGTLHPMVSTCGVHLFGVSDAKRVDCRACGATYTRSERETAMLRQMADRLATVRQAASALTKLGRAVTVKQIDGWLRRGLITARGVDQNRHRLVLVGDVLTQRQAVLDRAAARRKPTAA